MVPAPGATLNEKPRSAASPQSNTAPRHAMSRQVQPARNPRHKQSLSRLTEPASEATSERSDPFKCSRRDPLRQSATCQTALYGLKLKSLSPSLCVCALCSPPSRQQLQQLRWRDAMCGREKRSRRRRRRASFSPSSRLVLRTKARVLRSQRSIPIIPLSRLYIPEEHNNTDGDGRSTGEAFYRWTALKYGNQGTQTLVWAAELGNAVCGDLCEAGMTMRLMTEGETLAARESVSLPSV